MTNGGSLGTNGGRRVWLAGCGLLLMFVVLQTVVNATSVIDEARRFGRALPVWMPWTWEASGALAWIAVAPLIVLTVLRLRPPRLSWPATLATHFALTVPVSLAHVGLMVAMRKVIHALAETQYRLAPNILEALLYEWRKDVMHYALTAAAFAAIDWLAKRADSEAVRPAPVPRIEARIEVRDGSRTLWLAPADIQWAQAAGNYVELHTANGMLLHRATLASLERELAPYGFVRIHRSRLIRRDVVRAVETNASGDFDVVLTDGTRTGGSRRYRSSLES